MTLFQNISQLQATTTECDIYSSRMIPFKDDTCECKEGMSCGTSLSTLSEKRQPICFV